MGGACRRMGGVNEWSGLANRLKEPAKTFSPIFQNHNMFETNCQIFQLYILLVYTVYTLCH